MKADLKELTVPELYLKYFYFFFVLPRDVNWIDT